jgi:radical SAM enzyme (rSAM/lipoprotein system)
MNKKITLRKKVGLNLFKKYREQQAAEHRLSYLFWECTLRCNLACRHCGSDCTSSTDTPDMPLEDFLGALNSVSTIADPKNTIIVLTGGEPLMREDLEECGRAFYERGYPWGMVTNGLAMTGPRFNKLLAAGLRSITVSLDGMEESHRWMRGKKDSFQNAIETIRMVAATPELAGDVVTCVNGKNFKELGQIRDLLISLGMKSWRLFTIFPKGRAQDDPEMDVTNRQFNELMEFIVKTKSDGKIKAGFSCEGFLGGYEHEARDSFFFCRAGINIGSVLVDGSISACPSLRGDYIQGNIYRDDFAKIWNERFGIMRNRKWTRVGTCAECGVFDWCNGNGLHLRDEKTGQLSRCHYNMLLDPHM